MIRAIIFDVDDTLYSFKGAHEASLPALRRYVEEKLGLDGEEFVHRYDGMMEKQRIRSGENAAMHNRYIRFQMMLEEYGLPLRHVLPLNDFYWREVLSHSVAEPGVVESMDQLRAEGIRIGIGTDMTLDWQLEKLETLGLMDRIDFMVSSEEAGAEKPTRSFFDLCLAKAECRKEECMFLGDNIYKDALGAKNYGFYGVWYQPDAAKAAQHPEVLSIQTFRDLVKLVNRF